MLTDYGVSRSNRILAPEHYGAQDAGDMITPAMVQVTICCHLRRKTDGSAPSVGKSDMANDTKSVTLSRADCPRNLRNYNSRNDATITVFGPSQQMQNPSWAQVQFTGSRLELVISPPTSVRGRTDWTVRLRASALVRGTPVTRDTTVNISILQPQAPALTPTRQDIQAGVAFSVDVADFVNAGTSLPPPTYTLRGTQNPAWLSLSGSTISGTPPVATYTAATTDVPIEMTARNIAGAVDFTVNLRIARAVGPGVQSIPAQYAVNGQRFSVDLAGYLGGSPTPTIQQTGLPSWMRASGTVLAGTPTGYTQTTALTLTIHIRNVVGEITHTFALYVRVADETFKHATTGSPIETSDNNITALTATDSRFYFYSTDSPGHITVANHGGTIESSEQVNLGSANGANSTDVMGLAAHGGFLYVLGGTGARYVFKYRLSDRSLVGTQDVAGAGVALAVFPRNSTYYLGVLRTTGTVQVWSLDFPSSNQITLDFALSEPGVPNTDWQSLAYDVLDDQLYAGAQGDGGGFLFAFSTDGTRQPTDALQLQSGNDEPRGAGYGNDRLFVAQHDSGAAQGNIYVYDAIARILPIPAQSGFDGEPWTFDLSPYLANDITATFRSGYSKPAWLSLSNNVLSATALPAVARSRMDDTYTILLTGTHAQRNTDFSVELTVKYIEIPSTQSAPAQELDLRVTPTITNVHPPLKTSVVLHMLDYITNRERAGTITFSIQFDDENLTRLSSRTVDGVSVNDVLTITSPTTPLADEPVSSVNVDIRATNAVGHSDIDVPIDITNLMATYLNNIPAQDIQRDEIDTLNLQLYAGGRPRPTFALGTIVPTLTDDVATIISNANGRWSIHPDANLETTGTYRVNVIAVNRISRATGSFQMTIHGVPHTLPAIAPVWHTTGLTVDVDTGAVVQVNLAHLINTARPTPTFSITDDSELTNVGASASIAGTTLTITAPSTMDIDEDYTARIQVSARNSAGGAIQSLTVQVHYVHAPVWSTIPHQSVRPGQTWTLDLNSYLTASPAAVITFQTAPSGDASNATLAHGVASWEVPDTITEDAVHPFTFRATNSAGSTDVSVGVAVVADAEPVWTDAVISLNVQEGQRLEPFDLSEYLTAGVPAPNLYLGADAISNVPADITFNGLTMLVTPTLNSVMTQTFTFSITAQNASGSATKQITLGIHPVFEDNDNIVLNVSDYDQIRKLIDSRATVQDLPDEIISADSIVGGAISWAIDTMPVYAGNPRNLQELVSKRRAIIYRAAGILAASVRQAADPRIIEGQVNELQLQSALFAESERAAAIAQERFVQLGLTEDDAFGSITFRVVR